MASKRKTLCVDEKISLIRAIEKGERKSDVGRRFGFSPSTIATIWKNKEKILLAEINGSSFKKLRKPKFEDLDQAVLTWFNSQRQNNVPISGPFIKTQAEKIANELGITAFKASEGWLGKFKQRHNIKFGKINEDVQDVDMASNSDWFNKVWPKLSAKYAPSDIFNADEAGIFFRMTPDKTLKFKGEKCVEGKLSKERITVLVTANMDGTEKRKLMVIGSSQNPSGFKNIKRLPVTYRANKFAWMTSQLFEEEIRKWDAELKGRKILLLIDKCPAHPLIPNLRNIEFAYFPANTSVLQPMDQGVIKSLKAHYRKQLLMELIASDCRSSINMLHAVNFLSKSWKDVTAATIQYSFRQAGLCNNPASNEVEAGPLREWSKQFQMPQNLELEYIQAYVEVDEDLATCAPLTDEPILKSVKKSEILKEDEDHQVNNPEPAPSIQQALDGS